MWWFAILYFVNAVAPHNTLIYNDDYRLVIAGMPINILDGLMLLCGILSIMPSRSPYFIAQVHPAFKRGLLLLFIAFGIGVLISFVFSPDLPSRFRLPPIRNFVLAPLCLFMGYRALSYPRQARTAFWIVFISSIGSAAASIISQGQATSALAETSRASFDTLRHTALDVSGDAGLLAASVILFCMVSGTTLLNFAVRGFLLVICAAGMFLIPHRSTWLLDVMTLAYAGFIMWPFNMGRKILANSAVFLGLLASGFVLMLAIQAQTNRDFSGWVEDRLASLLPGSEKAHEAKAWDTRVPGMVYELKMWLGNPVLGRGFAAQEDQAIKDAEFYSFRHTPWASTLCETGLIGFAGFAFVIVGLAVVGTRLARQGPDRWFVLLGAIGASWGVVCFIAGFFTLHWNSPRAAITLGLLAGLIFRARDLSLGVASQPQQLPLAGYANRSYEPGYV